MYRPVKIRCQPKTLAYCNFPQIVSLPNLRIIDFGYGFTGSTHDATAWEHTRIAREHENLLLEKEFVWADSAYPVSVLFFTFACISLFL
jgi:hypothetical protein